MRREERCRQDYRTPHQKHEDTDAGSLTSLLEEVDAHDRQRDNDQGQHGERARACFLNNAWQRFEQ
jgi:hypothetical protein